MLPKSIACAKLVMVRAAMPKAAAEINDFRITLVLPPIKFLMLRLEFSVLVKQPFKCFAMIDQSTQLIRAHLTPSAKQYNNSPKKLKLISGICKHI
jgi:hypothetical protein